MAPLVALTATALIMGGTGHPLTAPQDSPEFVNGSTSDANNDYILLTGFCGAGSCTPTAVGTPEQIAASTTSYTGHYLKPVLEAGRDDAEGV